MASASNIVSVDITVKDKSAATANFGQLAIIAPCPYSGVRTYTADADGLLSMVADGFDTDSAAYVSLATMAGQSPTVADVKVFHRSSTNVQTIDVTPTITTEGYEYSWSIVGTDGIQADQTYEVGAAATVDGIIDAIVALINGAGGPAGVTATGDPSPTSTKLVLTQEVSGARFYIRNFCRGFTVDDASTDATIATALTAALALDPDFYGFVIDSTSGAEIVAAAAWAETNKRQFFATTLDSDVVATGSSDVASTIKATAAHYANVWVGRDGCHRIGDAIAARQYSRDPGSSTFALKSVALTTVDDWTATELGYARGKNANTYVPIAGLSVTLDGKACSGRFTDVVRDVDWLAETMRADVITVLANEEKVPYTDVGLALIENAIRARLSVAQSAGMLAAGWTVTAPLVANQTQQNRANRIVDKFIWNATLAGAVHKVVISGTLTV